MLRAFANSALSGLLPDPVRAILFVDDDPLFLEMIERLFRLWSKGRLRVLTTHSVGKAIMLLQDNRVDITVIDMRMPVVDGLQFLKMLHRKHPNMHKVMLTGLVDEGCRTVCLAAGASLFLEKPCDPDEMESVYAALVDLANSTTDVGFSGVMKQANLGEMVQMLCLSGNSVVLELQSGVGSGQIFISRGAILHASALELEGYDAFYFLMSLRSGDFIVRNFYEPPSRTISGSWETLLLESARQTDEQASVQEQSPFPIPAARRNCKTVPLPSLGTTADLAFGDWDEALCCTREGAIVAAVGLDDPGVHGDFIEFIEAKAGQISSVAQLGALQELTIEGETFNAVVAIDCLSKSFASSHQKKLLPKHLSERLKRWDKRPKKSLHDVAPEFA